MGLKPYNPQRIVRPSERVKSDELVNVEIQEYPSVVKGGIVEKGKRRFFGIMSPKIKKKKDLKEPLLFLMKEDGSTDIIENVKPSSLFTIKLKNGEKKGVYLSQKKMTTFNIEGNPRGYIAHENEMLPYPHDILYDGKEFMDIQRRQISSRKELHDAAKTIRAKMMFWLAIGGLILAGLYFGVREGWFEKIFG